MQGIELSRRFYADIVRPWLGRAAPGLRHAAAIGGYGSELLGFDDETSRDHNWGPRVHIFLTEEDFEAYARRMVEAFSAEAPPTYLGEPIGWRSRPHAPANGAGAAGVLDHGLEFHTLESSLERQLAVRSVDNLGTAQWLGFAEQQLLAFTAGAVFHDDDGHLSAARRRLAYFPDDVWLYKIACQWRRIAEEQAFVGRAGQVGDELGSRVIAARLVREVMRMAFLLEGRYAPYPKWFGSSFARLPLAAQLSPHLLQAIAADAWDERGDALAAAYVVLAERQKAMDRAAFQPVVGPYYDRPFNTINAHDAVAAAMAAIEDPELRARPVIGSLDQVSDLTALLVDPALSQRVMRQMPG
ncbi:MAG: DUF4037 domain-containing protein [Candidatus Devosia phytovorans]|uniref:DUF4037 domain-containing protein n=1 Tax=Candidatus Devosia phytovorans TaxID=3121372 RepID=A0AAJ5VY62_9HYPH|nr:DUF4037 domain-containing protein [Devosia sp.]WEK06597.1 MAG: DUF4037 domain-containing protein [Devosia sp.]